MMKKSCQVLIPLFLLILVACGPQQSETIAVDSVTAEPATEEPVDATEASETVEEPTDEATAVPEETDTPEPSPEPTDTPEPTNTPEPTEAPSLLERLGLVEGEPDLDVLAERLITIEDMPTGWSGAAVEKELNTDETYGPFCVEGLPARAIGNVSVDFDGGTILGPFIQETITAYRSVDEAKQSFEDWKNAANQCAEYTDEEGNELSLSPLSFPAYGDESFAIRMNMGGFIADAVRIRMDELSLSVMMMGTSTDAELQQELIEKALEKIEN